MSEAVPLEGGRITPGVVRVGDTVRRPQNPRSPFVHELLRHLERVGFEEAPRFLGVDGEGRETLSFRQGTVPRDLQSDHDDEVLRAAARLVRRYHDAVAGCSLADGEEVVCHDDLSPVNTVFEDGMPVALIDFDNARPGPRIRDLAYAIFLWLDFWEEGAPVDEQARRTALFLDTYGIELLPTELVDVMLGVQRATAARRRNDDDEDAAAWWDGVADWLEQNRQVYEAAMASRNARRTSSTAGAIVLVDGLLVATLNDDHLPPELDDGSWLRVGGVGGGCEPGESCVECADREAREELSVEVELVSSPVTYASSGGVAVGRVDWDDEPAPFVWDEGDDCTGALFAARLAGEPKPGDDVVALILLRPEDWGLLEESPTVSAAEAAGVRVVEARPLARETRLWVDADESMRVVAPLIERHPEVFDA